ncbi:MAG TPA: efflux transporter outer membrane subunit [Draconibacterium sp.]|nr:efflux transporter outer membrane subunit [Draconibacterium sp.]
MVKSKLYIKSVFSIWLKVFLVAILLYSCKVGPNYLRTQPTLPETYRQVLPADTAIVNIPWWELFGDTVLVNLINEGLENNKQSKTALERIEEARLAQRIVRADLYPKINYAVGGSSTVSSGSSSMINDYKGAVDVSYTFDIWGRVSRLEEAAVEEYLATEEAYRGLQLMLVSDIASAYITLRDIDNRLLISEKTAETWKANLDIVLARQKAGFVSEVDLNMAKIQLLEAQTAIQSFTRLQRQMENAICLLLGKTPEPITRGMKLQEQISVPEIPVGLPSYLLDRRPDVLQSERMLHAQTARIGAAEALKYPQFTISSDLGMSFVNPVNGFAALGAQILGPIFNNKANINRIEIEKSRTIQMLNQYEFTVINAVREVEDAMIAVKTYQNEFELRSEQMTASNEAMRLSWVRYESGLTSYLEVLDLQRSSFSSQLKASETLQYQLISVVQLYQALGGGWIE